MTEEEEMGQRLRVVEVAKTYLHTPWRHIGQSRAGVDCGGLAISIFKECNLIPQDFKPDYYPPDFMLHHDEQKFIEYIERVGYKTDRVIGKPADIALFKVGRVAAHCALVLKWPRVIQAVKVGDSGEVEYDDADNGELADKFVGIWTLREWT
jgi:cell wall-associated NlpC family hydrolase